MQHLSSGLLAMHATATLSLASCMRLELKAAGEELLGPGAARARLQHARELGVAVGDVALALGERVDDVAEREQAHVDADALAQPRAFRLGPLLPLAACALRTHMATPHARC